MKKIILLCLLLIFIFNFLDANENEVVQKTEKLVSQKKFLEALEIVDDIIIIGVKFAFRKASASGGAAEAVADPGWEAGDVVVEGAPVVIELLYSFSFIA